MALESSSRGGRLAGMSMKHMSIIALTLQNSMHILVMRYSRIMPLVDGHRYYASTAVLLGEVIKLTISLTMALYTIAIDPKTPDTSTATGLFAELARAVFTGDSWKLAIPAMLYTFQSSLNYVALSNLDAATFQVTDELKVLSTAVFSVIILGKVLSVRKWLSLLLLMLGIAIVQIPANSGNPPVLSMKDLKGGMAFHEPRSIWDLKDAGSRAAQKLAKRSATYEGIQEDLMPSGNPNANATLGLICVLIACTSSGLASVYFEKILKDPRGDRSASIWTRQIQLSFYSLWPALFIGVIFLDGEHISKDGFFAGYNSVVWLSIMLQAAGGLLVSFVINFANNITKNFATSVSIVLSILGSVFFFDMQITGSYLFGTAIVLSAVYLYNLNGDEPRGRPPQIRVPDAEKSGHSGYFDLESVVAPARSPMRNSDALTSSRPGTPTVERRPPKTPDLRAAKRQQ